MRAARNVIKETGNAIGRQVLDREDIGPMVRFEIDLVSLAAQISTGSMDGCGVTRSGRYAILPSSNLLSQEEGTHTHTPSNSATRPKAKSHSPCHAIYSAVKHRHHLYEN